MSRELTFQCIGCGVINGQSKRGKLRTRCQECNRKHKNEWMADYQKRKKANPENNSQASA